MVAGVFVEGELSRQLLAAGVKDSKQITSDARALDLAQTILRDCWPGPD